MNQKKSRLQPAYALSFFLPVFALILIFHDKLSALRRGGTRGGTPERVSGAEAPEAGEIRGEEEDGHA